MLVTQQMLLDAYEAYAALMTGQAVTEFRDQNGETVKYSRANKNDLLAYIEFLKRELGVAVAPVGPMRVWM